jgi:hypothetical protein
MQIARLEEKLGALHVTDVNALKRTHHSLAQHVQTLAIEVRDAQVAATKLDGRAVVFTSEICAKEVTHLI